MMSIIRNNCPKGFAEYSIKLEKPIRATSSISNSKSSNHGPFQMHVKLGEIATIQATLTVNPNVTSSSYDVIDIVHGAKKCKASLQWNVKSARKKLLYDIRSEVWSTSVTESVTSTMRAELLKGDDVIQSGDVLLKFCIIRIEIWVKSQIFMSTKQLIRKNEMF